MGRSGIINMGPWVVYVVVNVHIGTFGGLHMATVVPSHSGHKVMQVGYRAALCWSLGRIGRQNQLDFFLVQSKLTLGDNRDLGDKVLLTDFLLNK